MLAKYDFSEKAGSQQRLPHETMPNRPRRPDKIPTALKVVVIIDILVTICYLIFG